MTITRRGGCKPEITWVSSNDDDCDNEELVDGDCQHYYRRGV